jgi:mono/diheme cytochrome c family protein
MRPPPRDFTKGAFKFTGVPGGALPSDADIVRTLRHGLKGTHMPAFGVLPEEDVGALVQYIKTFSPRWRTETPGQEVPIPRDPWDSGHRTEGVKRGELVYHAVAQCWSCHPAYSRKDEIGSMVRAEWERAGKTPPRSVPFRSEIGRPKAVTSVYGKILPPDFLDDTLRSCEEKADLYRTVAAGVGGTPMPSWFKELPAVDLWAVVHYVEELTRIKGTPEGEVLRKRLRP